MRLIVVDRTSLGSLTPSSSHETGGATGDRNPLVLHEKGEEIGRAVVNYSATEITRIKGLRSSEIESVLGYADSEYVAFRENVSLYESGNGRERGSRPETPTKGLNGLSVRSPVAKAGDLDERGEV